MSLILNLLFPKTCFGCGKIGSYFCPKCRENIKIHSPKFSSKSPKEGSLSLFYYNGLIRQAIQSLKYEFVTDLADEFSSIFSQKIIKKYPDLLSYWQKNNFVLTPIPLYSTRQNWRGFNQSQLLGQLIAKKLKLTFSDQIIFRHRPTFTQSHLKTIQNRQQNIKNAFSPTLPIPKNLIIFDDVTTSFSTLNSAFNSIKLFGLNHCWFLTLSR
jgi:ComF family protein